MVSDDDVNHTGTWRGSGFFWLGPEFNFERDLIRLSGTKT
jgi:hypothetical protein